MFWIGLLVGVVVAVPVTALVTRHLLIREFLLAAIEGLTKDLKKD